MFRIKDSIVELLVVPIKKACLLYVWRVCHLEHRDFYPFICDVYQNSCRQVEWHIEVFFLH